ncbi:hypothetical protein L195_g028369, partial [Trifolium pratense]
MHTLLHAISARNIQSMFLNMMEFCLEMHMVNRMETPPSFTNFRQVVL